MVLISLIVCRLPCVAEVLLGGHLVYLNRRIDYLAERLECSGAKLVESTNAT